jgi:hypothetical protein
MQGSTTPMHRTLHPARKFLAIGCVVFHPCAFAAAPVYFDIGALLLYALCAIFGLLVFPICIALSKSQKRRRLFILLTFVCIVALGKPFLSDYLHRRSHMNGMQADADAFAKYCSENQRTIIQPEAPTSPVSLSVRHESVDGEPKWIGGAGNIATLIRQDRAFCSRSGITTVAPASPRTWEEAQYSVCTAKVTQASAPVEFEMLIRDSYESKKGTGNVPWGTTMMYKSKIVLTRKPDKRIIAEGDFYFVSPYVAQIGARCPKTNEAILDFLATAIP